MKRTTKQLLSVLLAIVMVVSLAVPALGATSFMDEAAETAAVEAETPAVGRSSGSSKTLAQLSAASETKTLDMAAEFSADVATADLTAGVEKNGFTITGNTTNSVISTGQQKQFPDGYYGTVRFAYGTEGAKDGPSVSFTTTGAALVKVWWVQQAGPTNYRQMAILDSTGTQVEGAKTEDTSAKNAPVISYLSVPSAGTYYLVPTGGANYLFKVAVTEGASAPTAATALETDIGTPTVSVAATTKDGATVDGSWDVTVTGTKVGVADDGTNVTRYADSLTVEMYKDGEETAVASKAAPAYVDATEGATITMTASGSGSYTFKAVAKQGDSVTLTSAASKAVTYTLPLAVPTLRAVAGDGKVTLSWSAVAEATGYEVYQGENKLTGTPTEANGVYTLEVTELTNDTEYAFTLKALRGESDSTTSTEVKATPKAPSEEGQAVTYQYSLKAADVAKDATDKTELSKADLTAATTVSVDGGTATAPARYFGITLGETTDKGDTVAGTVLKRGTTTNRLEIFKQGAASVDFTIKGTGSAELTFCSTGTSNVSMMALVDDAGTVVTPTIKTASKITIGTAERTSYVATDTTAEPVSTSATAPGVVVVYGNQENNPLTTVTYSNLTAGTYHIVSWAPFTARAGCLIQADVTDVVVAKPVTKVYNIKAADVAKDATDKTELSKADLTAATTVSVDGGTATAPARYFGITLGETTDKGDTVAGTVLKRGTTTNRLEIFKQGAASVDFTIKGTGSAELTFCSTGTSNVSMMALVDDAGTVVTPTIKTASKITIGTAEHTSYVATDTTAEPVSTSATAPGVVVVYGNQENNPLTIVTYSNLTAGTYHIVSWAPFTTRAGCLIEATVSDTYMDAGEPEDEVVAWTVDAICGTPVYTATAGTDGTITVSVVGPAVGAILDEAANVNYIYADKLSIIMMDKDGKELLEAEDNAEGDTHSATFTPSASGDYTFKVRVKRDGETDLDSAASTPATAFVLPLATPSIDSVANNGTETGKTTVSTTVMWAKVPEATHYQLQYRVKGATEWTTLDKFAAPSSSNISATVTGLAVDTEYEYQAKAFRNDEATDWSAVFAAAATTAKQQRAWTAKSFGPRAIAKSNVVISSDNSGTYQNELGWQPKTTWANGTYDFTVTDSNGEERTAHYEGLTGDINTDPEGRVLLSSQDGRGKIQEPNGSDGMLFYYTTIPAGTNYTLEADVHVIDWNNRDTQNGFGLIAVDRVPGTSWSEVAAAEAEYWNNSYMSGAARLGFYYDKDTGTTYASTDTGADAYTKYTYRIGLTSVAKYGIPLQADGSVYDGSSVPSTWYTRRFPLDTRLAAGGRKVTYNGSSNQFNVIGNYSTKPDAYSLLDEAGKSASDLFMSSYELTDVHLVLRKSNTGYEMAAYDMKGNLLGTNIEYFRLGAMSLSATSNGSPFSDSYLEDHTITSGLEKNLDADCEYIGLFTSRDMQALFSNVKVTTVAPEDDDPEADPPTTYVTPKMSISSGTSSNSEDFKLSISANVDGTAVVYRGGSKYGTYTDVKADVRYDVDVKLDNGSNSFKVEFTPDPNQDLGDFTELANTDTLTATSVVQFKANYADMTNLYVAPGGRSGNTGTRARPLDVYTAVSVVRPGQNIILLEGEYKLTSTIKIGRGMNGTENEKIYFMADIDETTGEPVKVVFNGQGKSGTVINHGANYWVFKDFEVVGSSNGSTAFQVGGSHNLVQNVSTHDNGSSGLAISRFSSSDHVPVRDPSDPMDQSLVKDWGDWPCDNLILNCTSYRNYDSGYQGADGFCAKIYVGSGNVFDGCVSYWNADDGWDLYAKTGDEEGVIGKVILRNCITFENGYEVRLLADAATQTPYYEDDGYTPKLNIVDGKVAPVLTADGAYVGGNGNGFKMGGSHMPGPHEIYNSYSFYNKAKGFDSNNGPDVSVIGCTAFNNGDENIGLSSKYSGGVSYTVKQMVSFKDDNCPIGNNEEVKQADSVPREEKCQIDEETYYAWDGTKSANKKGAGEQITAASFASTTWDNRTWMYGSEQNRDADGSLNLGDFLKLTGVTTAGAGDLVNDAPVDDVTVDRTQDTEDVISAGGGGGGGGGTIADKTTGTTGGATTEPEETYTAKEKTSTDGDKTITVTADSTGEVVAEVTIPATIPAPETKFDDVPEGHWAEESINNMAGLGIVKGVGGNKYDMDSAVTRGTIATMLFRFANGKEGKTNTFADVAGGQWYTDAIAWAADVGVVNGYSDTTFGPDDTITREQLAVMLWRFAKLIGMDGAATADLDGFGDADSVSTWAADGMTWCVEKGIINGVSADTLSPATSATRAQTATMLDRFIGLMK